jgi:tetratricopeptide (TPR) repeat protein
MPPMSERLTQLLKLHEADPADPFCTYGIALEHAKAGRSDEAIQWLDRTLGLDERYCYAYYQKARVLAQDGQDEAARQVLRHGIEVARAAATPDSLHAAQEMSDLLQSI